MIIIGESLLRLVALLRLTVSNIGESGTGKSCLLHHFINEQAKDNPTQTIGVEFASRIVQIGNRSVKLQVSSGGQQDCKILTGVTCYDLSL